MVNNIANRIKLLRKELGLTQEAFGARLGLEGNAAKVTVSNWERNHQQPSRNFQKIADVFGVSLDWLLSGQEPMFINSTAIGKTAEIKGQISEHKIIALKALNCLSPQTDEPIEWYFSTNWLSNICENISPESIMLLKIYGNSMEPNFKDDDICLVNRNDNNLLIDLVYALKVNDSIIIRRFAGYKHDEALFSCDNPINQPLVFNKSDVNNEILGKVVWIGRKLKN